MIRLLVPDMPTAAELTPYLHRIDAARIYSNGGPLMRELEAELGQRLGMPVAAVSNGTVAIELALRSLRLPRGALALVPAMTFVGTGQAISNAGLRPYLCDIEQDSWQLSATTATRIVEENPRRTFAVAVPVATYGMPVEIGPWEAFADATGIPVVIDAAGALGSQAISAHPMVLTTFSLHATKFVGAGEGGFVVVADRIRLQRIAELASFGAWGTNAKLSEYHAAVALAALSMDRYRAKWDRTGTLAHCYLAALREAFEVEPRASLMPPGGVPSNTVTLLTVLLPETLPLAQVRAALAAAGIECKQWYSPLLDERSEFSWCLRTQMPNTRVLRRQALGLPFHTEMTPEDVRTVVHTLANAA